MAIDNGAYIAELDVNLPADRDARAEGAKQIRNLKKALQDSFPNIDAPVDIDSETLNRINDASGVATYGFKQEWCLPLDQLPAGYALMDGSVWNNVVGQSGPVTIPDLRNMMTRNVGPSKVDYPIPGVTEPAWDVGDLGGNDYFDVSDALNAGQGSGHKMTVEEMPSHNHPGTTVGIKIGSKGDSDGSQYRVTYNNTGVNVAAQGGNKPHIHEFNNTFPDNRPDFYTVAFVTFVGVDAVKVV